MTKAEAIEVLKNTAWLGTDIHMSKVDNALRVIEQENISCDAVNIWSGHTTIPNEIVFDFSDGTRKAVKVVEDRREQEPCEDAISRDAVYEILMRSDFRDTCSYETFKKRLDALPSVTPKPTECEDAISRDIALEKMADYVASGYADSAEDFEEYSRIICQLPSVTQKSGKCKNCKYFEYDSVAKVDGVPLIVAHEICNKWGNGFKTSEDWYCYLFEPQESEDKE